MIKETDVYWALNIFSRNFIYIDSFKSHQHPIGRLGSSASKMLAKQVSSPGKVESGGSLGFGG